MAHHGDAVGMCGDRLAELLDHLFLVPPGKDVVDLGAGVMRRLHRAIVDDGAEAVPLGAADEEADMRVAAPFVAQRIGAGDAGRGQKGYRRQSAGKQP